MYERWSPSRFVTQFQTPTLVVHGEKDYRVPVTQGMQLFTALQLREVPSRFLHFPDEGHWILKPRNSVLWYETVTGWLKKWIDNPHTPSQPPAYQRPELSDETSDQPTQTVEPVDAEQLHQPRPSPIQR
jgi:fermentation-respiration switch protein FrsA (DUF1100 family)